MLTWPTRARRYGRWPHALAITVAAVCALWAGSLQDLGSTYRYQYEYQGLRLLISRSGTYYLLPAGWTPRY